MAGKQNYPREQLRSPLREPAPGGYQAPTPEEIVTGGYKAAVEPVTKGAAYMINRAALPPWAQDTGLDQTIAEFIVPQSPVDMAIFLSSVGVAPLVAKMGVAGATKVVMRMLGPGLVGGATGYLTDESLSGFIKGVTAGSTAEVARWAGYFLRNRDVSGRITRELSKLDSMRIGEYLEKHPGLVDLQGKPIVQGARSVEDMIKLVGSNPRGKIEPNTRLRHLLSNYMESVDDKIAQNVGNAKFQSPTDPSTFLTFREARHQLRLLRESAYPRRAANPETRQPSDIDPIAAYLDARNRMKADLARADKSGQSLQIFEKGNRTFGLGRALDHVLSAGPQTGGSGAPVFHTDSVLKDAEKFWNTDYAMTNALGEYGEEFVNVVSRGTGLYTKDTAGGNRFIGLPGVRTSFPIPPQIKPRGAGQIPGIPGGSQPDLESTITGMLTGRAAGLGYDKTISDDAKDRLEMGPTISGLPGFRTPEPKGHTPYPGALPIE